MGFYLRKSFRVGPVRFNLSKSGIGTSIGIPGFRIGSGPRGAYAHLGRGGFYYRQSLNDVGNRSGTTPLTHPPSTAPDGSVSALQRIGSVAASVLECEDTETWLNELREKRARLALWLLPIGIGAVLFAIGYLIGTAAWLLAILLILVTIATFYTTLKDALYRNVVLMYDLSEEFEQSYREFCEAASKLGSSNGLWHVHASGAVHDRKYHAGAGSLIDRSAAQMRDMSPRCIKTNVSTLRLSGHRRSITFLPDCILLESEQEVGTVSYRDLRFDVSTTRFIEEGSVPSDARIVGQTWRYVNKKGGPDRRFSNNYEIPICEYEEINLSSNLGLRERFQASRIGVGTLLDSAVRKYCGAIAAERQKKDEEKEAAFLDSVFDIACCLAVSDGRLSVSERTCVAAILKNLNSPLDSGSIEQLIDRFVSRIKTVGFSHVVEESLEKLRHACERGYQAELLKMLDTLASADKKSEEAEQKLIARIRSRCSSIVSK